ncbi:MAG: phosphate regulon transcriptional regulator PhoB [Gammaproteobacteria bacterium]|nr:phosphate regulon transcriptional regulator PhoB [Gammaproteobacteria bacterium]
MAYTILIVEDEESIREMIAFSLEQAGFAVLEAGEGAAANNVIANVRPDLILLDWMLPGLSGVEIARRLKREQMTADIPIIMLTARGEEDERLRGFDAGADDYITKPFSTRELVARIKAVLRRTSGMGDDTVSIGGLVLDKDNYRVSIDGKPLELGPTEFKLLSFFMTHPERVYSRTQLLDRVWGSNVYVEERTVDVHIRRLRKALEAVQRDDLIQTVRGAGYRFSASV